jgi:hypothetical protein
MLNGSKADSVKVSEEDKQAWSNSGLRGLNPNHRLARRGAPGQ